MLKLIPRKENTAGKLKPIDLQAYTGILQSNIQETIKQKRIQAIRESKAQYDLEAEKATSTSNIARLTWEEIRDRGLGFGIGVAKSVTSAGLTVAQGAKDAFPGMGLAKPMDMRINVFGQEARSLQSVSAEEIDKLSKGETTPKKAAGTVAEPLLDVVSTLWVPGWGLKIIKGGKIVSGAIVGGISSSVYGGAYGAAGAAKDGKSAQDIVSEAGKSALIGAAGGFALGGATGFAGKLFKRQEEIATNPTVIEDIVGQQKDLTDYLATRTDLTIQKMKSLGVDQNGNKVLSKMQWDYQNNTGTLLLTREATDQAVAHEVGHYIDRKYPALADQYKKEVSKVSGGRQNLNEDFSDVVGAIVRGEPAAISGAPKLTQKIRELGIKVEEQVRAAEVQSVKSQAKVAASKKTSPIQEKKVVSESAGKEVTPSDRISKSDFENVRDYALSRESTASGKKGVSMEFSAIKRNLEGTPTQKEYAAAEKYLASNYVGKEVSVGGQKGTIQRTSFGKPQVKLKDGSVVNVAADQVKSKAVTKKDVIDFLKEKGNNQLKGRKNVYGYKEPAKPAVTKKKVAEPTKKASVTSYTKESKTGTPTSIPKEKAPLYEKKVERISKSVPIVERLLDNRKKMGPTPKKKVQTEGINWNTVNTSEQTKGIIDTIFKESDQFKSVRPSRTDNDILEGAYAVGINTNDKEALKALIQNMPNANVAQRLKQAMVDSATDLMQYMRTIDTATLTEVQKGTIRDKFLRTQSIAEAFSGLRTESSHLLRSMGIPVMEGDNFSQMSAKLVEVMGEANGDPLRFLRKTKTLLDPTKTDTALGIWYNMILSGYKTWSRNMLDNTLAVTTEALSKVANPTTTAESVRFIAGIFKALPKSLYKAGRVLVGKEKGNGKIYSDRYKPYFKNKAVNLWLTEISGRILEAQDMISSNVVKEAQKSIDTFSKQMKRAGISEDTAVRLNDAVDTQFSERTVYRNRPMGGPGIIAGGAKFITSKIPALKIIVPFTNVVANVVDRKIDYLPIFNTARTFGKKYLTEEANIILKKTDINPGMYDTLRPVIMKRLKQQQLGRFYLGMIASTAAYSLAMDGRISGGGPKNLSEKQQLEDAGWRPYSIKIGDIWIPYIYLGPLGGIFSAAGSIGDAYKYGGITKDLGTKISNGVVGFMQFNLAQSFLSGTSDLISVINGQKSASKYINSLIAGVVPIPAMWTQVVQSIDGGQYDVQTLGEALQWKLGITKNLTPRLNALGEQIRQDAIYGLTPSKEKDNLSAQLEKRGLIMSLPAKTTKLEGEQMTREQLFRYTIYRGEILKKNSDKILKMVDKEKNDDMKKKIWDKSIQEVDTIAKERLRKELGIKKQAPKRSQEIPSVTIKK